MADGLCTFRLGNCKADQSVISFDGIFQKNFIVAQHVFQFLFVLLLLRVVDRQEFHEEIRGVGKLWNGPVDLFEVLNRSFGITLVNNIAVAHQNQSVKEEEGLGTG